MIQRLILAAFVLLVCGGGVHATLESWTGGSTVEETRKDYQTILSNFSGYPQFADAYVHATRSVPSDMPNGYTYEIDFVFPKADQMNNCFTYTVTVVRSSLLGWDTRSVGGSSGVRGCNI